MGKTVICEIGWSTDANHVNVVGFTQNVNNIEMDQQDYFLFNRDESALTSYIRRNGWASGPIIKPFVIQHGWGKDNSVSSSSGSSYGTSGPDMTSFVSGVGSFAAKGIKSAIDKKHQREQAEEESKLQRQQMIGDYADTNDEAYQNLRKKMEKYEKIIEDIRESPMPPREDLERELKRAIGKSKVKDKCVRSDEINGHWMGQETGLQDAWERRVKDLKRYAINTFPDDSEIQNLLPNNYNKRLKNIKQQKKDKIKVYIYFSLLGLSTIRTIFLFCTGCWFRGTLWTIISLILLFISLVGKGNITNPNLHYLDVVEEDWEKKISPIK